MNDGTAYGRIAARLARGGTVLLDGGIGSELQEVGYPPPERRGTTHGWGTLALYHTLGALPEPETTHRFS